MNMRKLPALVKQFHHSICVPSGEALLLTVVGGEPTNKLAFGKHVKL